MKARLILGLCLLLSACASSPPENEAAAAPLLADALFPAAPPPELHADVFALSAAMRDYLATGLAQHVRARGPRRGLVEAIRDDLAIRYDASFTRTAAEAFEGRSGNCLSLLILTAAFARQLDIPLHYQSVFDDDTWSRSNGLAFLSGHVNVTLGQRSYDTLPGRDPAPGLTVDFFLPDDGEAALHTRAEDEATIVAMYLNNRAAETLAAGQLNAAYWWAREAILKAPRFDSPYNTLGVIYGRLGQRRLAEQALRYALQREPANELVIANLADLLTQTGRSAEAEQLRLSLSSLGRHPPYYYYDLGLAALRASDYAGAREQFSQQLRRTPYDHEVLFALGMTHLRLGELRQARKYVALALENSTTLQSQGIYAAKLEHLRALQRQN